MRRTHLVMGGGTAGCVLASRLSEDPRNQVLLVEAGSDYSPAATPNDILDSYAGYAWVNRDYYWNELKFRRRDGSPAEHLEQARVIGGGSSINGQVSLRGAPGDFDNWERLGATGWNWRTVFPWFQRIEHDLDFDGPLHGKEGPIKIRRIPRDRWDDFTLAVAREWESRGLPYLPDLNAEFGDGYGGIPSANDGRRRYSTALAYLTDAVRARPNLEIRDRARVLRLVVQHGAVKGAVVERGGSTETVTADVFVLAAGAIRSPTLLMLSGIGPGRHLQDLGIEPVLVRPGVGSGLQDHPAVTVSAYLSPQVRPVQGERRNYTYLRYSSGHAGCNPSDMVMAAVYRSAWHAIGRRIATLSTFMGQAFSRGEIRLRSPDPAAEPDVCFNHLVDLRDRHRMMDAVRFMAGIFFSKPVAAVTSDVFPSTLSERVKKLGVPSLKNRVLTQVAGLLMDLSPALRRSIIATTLTEGFTIERVLTDEAALERFVMEGVITGYHPGGTCRMGDPDDPMTVVDFRGRVTGLANLHVADASVMPELPRTNINLPTIMIAERIAAMLTGRPG